MNRAAAGRWRWSGAALLAGLALGGGPPGARHQQHHQQHQPQAAQDQPQAAVVTSFIASGDTRFVPKLGAQFLIEKVDLPGFPQATAARIVSQPVETSPLRKDLGLAQGDVITRLDGDPVTNLDKLDNHIGQTTVRFSKQGTKPLQDGVMFIPDPGGPVPPPGGGEPLPP